MLTRRAARNDRDHFARAARSLAVGRVAIIGSPGSGKTYTAERLAALTRLPLQRLDDHYWHPGWTRTPDDEWRRIVDELSAESRWILDGNYVDTIPCRAARAGTILFLDLPPALCALRVFRRYARSSLGLPTEVPARVGQRALNPVGTGRLAFLRFVARFRATTRPKILSILAEHRDKLVVLRSPREIDAFLEVAARLFGEGSA